MIISTLPEGEHIKIMSFICDILLTQTGTGNFLAWYFNERNRISETSATTQHRLFNAEADVELGNDIEYVIDIEDITKNTKRKKKSTFSKFSIFSSNFSMKTSNRSQGGVPYDPPEINQSESIDILAHEPRLTSGAIPNFLYANSIGSDQSGTELYIDSSANLYNQPTPENMNEHIAKTYGDGVSSAFL